MIKIDGREYHGVSRKYEEGETDVLVTYTADGEPSAPLFTGSPAAKQDLLNFIADSEEGVIQNIKLWRLLAVVE